MNVWFLAGALLAEIIGTIGGFGSSVFLVPIAAWFYPFQTVLVITAFMHVTSNLSKLVLFREHIVWGKIFQMGLPSTVAVIAGSMLSSKLPEMHYDLILGIALIILSGILFYADRFELKETKGNFWTFGLISGFLAGLVGTGGAIRGLMLSSMNLPKNLFVATSAGIDMLVDSGRSIVYYESGFLKSSEWTLIPILLGLSLVGSWIGKQILSKMKEDQFKPFVLALILLIGITQVVSHFLSLNS